MPPARSERLRPRPPRTIAQLMAVVALCGLAFAGLRWHAAPPPPAVPPPMPGWRTFRAFRAPAQPFALPGLTPVVPPRPDPAAINPRFVVAAPEGIDDGMVVIPERLRGGRP